MASPASKGKQSGVDWNATDVVDQFSRLRIVLGSNRVRVGFEKGRDLGIEVRDVLFGPFDL